MRRRRDGNRDGGGDALIDPKPPQLRRKCADKIVAHARGEAPRECCGVLIGTPAEVVDAIPGRNIADEPATQYLLDPQDHFHALREARQRSLKVVGFYHSHPHSAPLPSDTDRSRANYPNHLYVIVGLASLSPELAMFELVDGDFLEVPLVTVD